MKRTPQTSLKFGEHLTDQSGSDIEMDESDKDKDYTPVQEVESESDIELYETDQPSTSKYKSKREKKSKRSKIVKLNERKQSKTKDRESSSKPNTKYSHHFTFNLLPNNNKVASCNLCKQMNTKTENIKMSQSNTSGLKWHLKTKHPQEFVSLFPATTVKVSSLQPTLEQVLTSAKAKPKMISPVNDEDIVEWISLKYLPFNFFEDEATQSFFKKINPNAVLPKRTAVREKVIKTFSALQKKVLGLLKDNKSKISFTIDGWTSINYKSYYGITGHFIDDSWNLNSIVIDFLPSNGQHTGKDIAELFFKCTKEYEIIGKIQGITVDNAAANTTFLKELEILIKIDDPNHPFNSEDNHFRCFAHILNLGVQDTLKLLKLEDESNADSDDDDNNLVDISQEIPPLTKLRILFKKIKKSEQLQTLLKTLCDAANIKYLSVNIDVSTRWNSTCDMLNMAIRLKKALNNFVQSNENFGHLLLTEDQWYLIGIVCQFLKYFKSLSTSLCGETYSTLPLVVVGFNIVLDKLESFLISLNNTELSDHHVEATLIQAFQAGRDKMLKHYYKTNWVYCAALILDPRHKMETFNLTLWGREIKEDSLKKFNDIFYSYYVKPSTDTDTKEGEEDGKDSSTSTNSSDEFMATLYKKKVVQNNADIAKAEFEKYIDGERASRDTNILKWWCEHEKIFPNLAGMARDILAIPATSVPAERLFSKAGLVIRKHRNRLNAESARILLCLNNWYASNLNLKEKLLSNKL